MDQSVLKSRRRRRGGMVLAEQGADLFVSYKAEDRARVRPLVDALESEGFSVWWDAHIGGGANWRSDIEEHLKAAHCVIVVWTKNSVGIHGEFVRDEAAEAKRRRTYLPVRLDSVELPLGFREVQAISLKGWRGNAKDARFARLVDAVNERLTGEPVEQRTAEIHPSISRRTLVGGGTAGIVAIAALGAWEFLKPSAGAARSTIAVLPFVNLSGDPAQAYFSDGMADEIRSALARLGGLTVIGSTSSEAVRNEDAKTAASKLGVANILAGNVRKSASTIRVTAELIDGRTGADRWTENYDRTPGDTIKIQTDIAQNVAGALQGALGIVSRGPVSLGGTLDSVAQDLILQSRKLGRESNSLESSNRRIQLSDEAIARDPRYVDAYLEKADALGFLAIHFTSSSEEQSQQVDEAEAAVRIALRLAPQLGSAHMVLAGIVGKNLDFTTALKETKKSLALSPNDPVVLSRASRMLAFFESKSEGLETLNRAIALDPLNALLYRFQSELLIYLNRFQEAIEVGQKALSLGPDLQTTRVMIGDALLLLGRAADAKAEYASLPDDEPFRLSRLSLLAARTGDRSSAIEIMDRQKQRLGASSSYQYGEIQAQLGDKDKAFTELDNAVNAKDAGLVYLNVDAFLDPIRSDPRFEALLHRLNFP